MTSDILASAPHGTDPAARPAARAQTTAPASPAAAEQSREPRDDLAGLLPAWDLLPASPFVRRVK